MAEPPDACGFAADYNPATTPLSRRRTSIALVVLGIAIAGAVLTNIVLGQGVPLAGMHGKSGVPTLPGQDAFAALAEVARTLEADPNTDWSTVDLERLRQHLIDTHEVVLRSDVKPTPVPGGLAMAMAEPIAGGVRLVVVARKPDDARTVARIRGLGFSGLITEGAHHQPHHLAMAKGQMPAGHTH